MPKKVSTNYHKYYQFQKYIYYTLIMNLLTPIEKCYCNKQLVIFHKIVKEILRKPAIFLLIPLVQKLLYKKSMK